MTFICPIRDNQSQCLAVRREELEVTKIYLHVIKRRSSLSWVTLEPGLSSSDFTVFN